MPHDPSQSTTIVPPVIDGPAPDAGRVVLASASRTRLAMLEAAGVRARCFPARVDEAELKKSLTAEGLAPRDVADFLADMKAVKISNTHPEALTVGADQVLVLGGVMFDKPVDLDHAKAHLRALRGRSHDLISAVVVAEGGRPVWRHVGRARLAMRAFSDDFIERYLATVGATALDAVGAYQIEGLGAQLFEKVEGDYFTILGLPLLDLLGYLRVRGVLPS